MTSAQVLYCARKAGVTHVLRAGGAQAVAAMAWGTDTCPKVTATLGRLGRLLCNSAARDLPVRYCS